MLDKIMHFLSAWFSRNGDTTFWSWVITFMYLVTFISALLYTIKIRKDRGNFRLWIVITAFVFLLGINKQLDVQILLAMIWRYISHRFHLFEYRYVVYFSIILTVAVIFIILILFIFMKNRKAVIHSLLSIAGIIVLMLFVLMRANYVYIRHIHAVELAGLVMIFMDLAVKHRKNEPI